MLLPWRPKTNSPLQWLDFSGPPSPCSPERLCNGLPLDTEPSSCGLYRGWSTRWCPAWTASAALCGGPPGVASLRQGTSCRQVAGLGLQLCLLELGHCLPPISLPEALSLTPSPTQHPPRMASLVPACLKFIAAWLGGRRLVERQEAGMAAAGAARRAWLGFPGRGEREWQAGQAVALLRLVSHGWNVLRWDEGGTACSYTAGCTCSASCRPCQASNIWSQCQLHLCAAC